MEGIKNTRMWYVLEWTNLATPANILWVLRGIHTDVLKPYIREYNEKHIGRPIEINALHPEYRRSLIGQN